MNKHKPFLKWAGNKYRCLNHILDSFPKAARLIEPFTGSGAIFLNTNYPSYLLAEGNKDLVMLYHHVQKEGVSFIEYCKTFFCPINNCKQHYYRYRDQFNDCVDPRQRSALFLFLNRHGYNGLCRYNKNGKFNVPFGSYKRPYFPLAEMHYFHQKSQGTTFIHSDFRLILEKAEPGDLIYCDPPYAPLEQQTNFTHYTKTAFGEHDQITLAQLAIACANRGITVIISNHDTPFTRHHYRDSEIKSFRVTRSINCLPANRKPVEELLAIFR